MSLGFGTLLRAEAPVQTVRRQPSRGVARGAHRARRPLSADGSQMPRQSLPRSRHALMDCARRASADCCHLVRSPSLTVDEHHSDQLVVRQHAQGGAQAVQQPAERRTPASLDGALGI